jgi:hypothetical protein
MKRTRGIPLAVAVFGIAVAVQASRSLFADPGSSDSHLGKPKPYLPMSEVAKSFDASVKAAPKNELANHDAPQAPTGLR